MATNMLGDRLEISATIARLQRYHRRYMAAQLEDLNLAGNMHMILFTLHRTPGVSQDYLAMRFSMDKGIIARQCKVLEERNLIRREINTNDRRQYCLYLTEDGSKMIPRIAESYRNWNNTLCHDLTGEQAELVNSLLSTMVDSCITELGII